MPPGKAKTVEAWPVAFSAIWANCRLPSLIATAPVAGCPSAAATLTATAALVCPPWSLVVTVSEVCVDTAFDALCAPATAIGSTSSAKPSPATNSSRRLRRFMPLTCTCSKSPEESRIAKSRIARLSAAADLEDYCIWLGRSAANRRIAVCPEKPCPPTHIWHGPRHRLDGGRPEWRVHPAAARYASCLRCIAMTQANPRPQLAHLTAALDELRAKGTHFNLRVLDDQQAPVCHYDGKEVINLASNNYLGLANHPKLIEAALAATRAFGVGSGAVQTIAGTMRIHMDLEEKIARFKNVEACVVFQSGFAANAGTVSAILGKEDFILSDELNHASIIDGARLSRATIKVFRHKDMAHCEQLLQQLAPEPGKKLVITDGVFSMDGDIGPVDKLAGLAEKYGAIMMVDDAHASGVLGRNGRGSVDHFGMHGLVDVQVGTLSKAIGALGGYVCGSRDLIDYLYHRARPFLFSTSHPPSVAATGIAAFDILEAEPERIERLWKNTRYFQGELKRVGFNIGGVTTPATETPITPIIIGDGRTTMEFSRALFNQGVMGTGIAFPTVPEGKARIRLILTSEHTQAHLDQALETLERVAKQFKILQ